MENIQHLTEIADRLRQLQATSPDTDVGLDNWYRQSRDFTDWLSRGPGVALPAQLWHYLHDADIRVREPAYRAAQDEMINELISNLERGHVPASTGRTFSIDPRWLGATALALMAVILYWAMQ